MNLKICLSPFKKRKSGKKLYLHLDYLAKTQPIIFWRKVPKIVKSCNGFKDCSDQNRDIVSSRIFLKTLNKEEPPPFAICLLLIRRSCRNIVNICQLLYLRFQIKEMVPNLKLSYSQNFEIHQSRERTRLNNWNPIFVKESARVGWKLFLTLLI